MHEAGSAVTILGRREDVLAEAVEVIGQRARYIVGDIAKTTDAPRIAAEAERIGPVDVLVNNAGTHHKASALDTSDEEFLRVIQTNLLGSFALSREVARGMAQREQGCILIITSMAALFGIPNVPAYTASKTGLQGLTRELAVEFGPRGLRVNSIAPGFIETDMNREIFRKDPARLQKVVARTPLGRLGAPEDVAEAAVYLASPAARFVSGVCLPVDGGLSIGF